MKIFKRFRKEKSIYIRLLETGFNPELYDGLNLTDGSYELKIAKGEIQIKHIPTREINQAVDDYYARKEEAISEFEEFFKNHKAIEAERHFLTHLMQKIEFSEDRLIGLSILLMRDSTVEECVKFGMLMTKYYNLEEVSRAKEIFMNLSRHPAFIYYGIDFIKNIDYAILDKWHEEMPEIGKEIIEEKSWI